MMASLRIAPYLRVSTGRQAETDLSIPDQRRQIEAWARARGHVIVCEYAEAGASATDDKRPIFQTMIDRACEGEKDIDAIVVHSFSRFMRDSFAFEFYVRKLSKHGVALISIAQDVVEGDPAQVMMRKVIALFDEYQSKENAKHVLRAMKENARQGFWNGSRPPLGYRTVEVDHRGARIKKKLAVDLVEAEEVRLIFRLYMEGHDRSGPMGIKTIVNWLNARGHRTRSGARWAVGPLHKLLTNPVYAGRMRFNRCEARTKRRKPESEYVSAEVPPVIDPAVFERVQDLLKARNPKVTPPRVVTGPILLTGLATCASCSGGMTLRTGTSKSGRVHRYYTCSTCARAGKSACKGRSIRMDKLDTLVMSQLIDRLLAPERLKSLLTDLRGRRAARATELNARAQALEARAAEADERLRRLYVLVETGHAELDDLLTGPASLPSRRTGRQPGQRSSGREAPPVPRSSSINLILRPSVASCGSASQLGIFHSGRPILARSSTGSRSTMPIFASLDERTR
jgi:DNA invertase Pin-like site-specific DNA recombinase